MATYDNNPNYITPAVFNELNKLEYSHDIENLEKIPNYASNTRNNVNNNFTLKQLMAGKSAHQFAQEFVHNIHMQRISENQKPQSKFIDSDQQRKRNEGLYKSSSFNMNYNAEVKDLETKPTGSSVYTYLSNTIKMELDKKSTQKNRDQRESGVIHKLCKTMLSNENTKRIEEKANVLNYKASQEGLCSRLNQEAKEWKEKLEEEKKRVIQEQMVECSFVPKINEASKVKEFKNPEEYYAYQLKWEEKIKENIKNQKIEKEKKEIQNNAKPQISKKTINVAQNCIEKKKLSKDVHQRLYEIKKDQQIIEAKHKLDKDNPDFMLKNDNNYDNDDSGFFTKRNENQANDMTFTPKISIKSKILLQKKKEKFSKNHESPEKTHCTCYACVNGSKNQGEDSKICVNQSNNYKMSERSNIAFMQRFKKEFKETVKEILHQDNAIKLHFIELEEILKKMGFLRVEQDKKEIIGKETMKNSNSQILKEIWGLLKGKHKTWMTSRNLVVFLLAVMNIKADKDLVPLIEDMNLLKDSQTEIAEEIESEGNKKQYGRFGFSGNLELNDTDVQNIHRDYNVLYLNKIAKNSEINLSPEEYNYSPEINRVSYELAENQKKKLYEQFKDSVPSDFDAGSKIDYYQISTFRVAQKAKELEELRNSYFDEQVGKCTFTPYVSDFKQAEKKLKLSSTFQSKDSSKFHGTSPISIGKERYLELYSLKKAQSDKKDKDFNMIEYEKQCDECTFKPDLEKSRLKNDMFKTKEIYSKGIEKNIERIQKGRIEKNLVETLKQKGLAPNEARTNKLIEEIRRNEESKSTKISGLFRNSNQSSKFENPNEFENSNNYHNESGEVSNISSGNKHYSTIIPEDGVPTFGLRNDEDERIPLLFVDVNITEGRNARIVIYEGDKPEELAEKFAEQYHLESHMTEKLKELLELQINNLLHKIEEEEGFSESSQRE